MASTSTASRTAANLPGTSRLILVASGQYPRYSEADVVELKDGRLLLAVSRKTGSDDFAPGILIGLFSSDRGLTWDDQPRVIQPLWGDLTDLMSVSFCRSAHGVYLFFLGRGPDRQSDTRVYQMFSADEGKTWAEPVRVSRRPGYHIVNNARVIRTTGGRILVPAAYVPGSISKEFKDQRVFCLYSDDDGRTWRESNDLALPGKPLMEPGIAECADGSVYMTIRTAEGCLYQARSRDGGQTWADLSPTSLPSPAAPSAVFRAPGSEDLWLFWIDRPGGSWRQRNPLAVAVSRDHGRTWGAPRLLENATDKSFGYYSVTPVKNQVLLTYYDWRDQGQPNFQRTHLRERLIPRAWFRGEAVPPVFRTRAQPVLQQDTPWEGGLVSLNSGLVTDKERWRLWYTSGVLGPDGEHLRVCYAESLDQGRTWQKPRLPNADPAGTNVVLPRPGEPAECYHASVHRAGKELVAYVWRHQGAQENGLYRYVSTDDGRTFAREPSGPLFVSPWLKGPTAAASEGRVSNDAFDVVQNPDGTFEYFAACMVKAPDPRAIIKHDNAAGYCRFLGRATSADGIHWTAVDLVLTPAYDSGDPYDQQFYGIQVLRYRGFYLGVLHTYWAQSQIIQPEWAWSHNGVNWTRSRTPCISLGDEGSFDSRMIVFGSLVLTEDELVWLYGGSNWRHNAFRQGQVTSAMGRANLARAELDRWLDTLPAP